MKIIFLSMFSRDHPRIFIKKFLGFQIKRDNTSLNMGIYMGMTEGTTNEANVKLSFLQKHLDFGKT